MQTTLKSFEELEGRVFGIKKVTAKKKVMPKKLETETCSYEVLGVYEGTVIKVPKKSANMRYVPASLVNGEPVSEHWHNGKGLGGVFLNVFFYNITKKQLGKKIVAKVEVIKKTMNDTGHEFIMLNVYHTPEEECNCRYTFRMPKEGTGEFDIHPDVETRLYFELRKHNRLRP
jgi:hypothetical protein